MIEYVFFSFVHFPLPSFFLERALVLGQRASFCAFMMSGRPLHQSGMCSVIFVLQNYKVGSKLMSTCWPRKGSRLGVLWTLAQSWLLGTLNLSSTVLEDRFRHFGERVIIRHGVFPSCLTIRIRSSVWKINVTHHRTF